MLALRDILQVTKVTLHERLTSAGNMGIKSTQTASGVLRA
jgi:hypothetical protein